MRLIFWLICISLICININLEPSFAQIPDAQLNVLQQQKVAANDLLTNDANEEAYEAYMKLLREFPLDGEINLGVARSAYASKRYNQAIMAYERLIESYPNRPFLWIELTAVYIALNNPENAGNALENAKKLDPSLKDISLEDIIKAEQEKLKRFFVNGNISVGFGYDSNANSGPYSNKIVLGNFPLSLDEASVQQSSALGQAMVGSNFIYRGNRQSKLLFVSDFAFYGKYYFKNLVKGNNFLWVRLGLGFRYYWTTQYLEVRAKGDFAQYPSKKNITTVGGELTHSWNLTPRVSLLGRAGYEQQFYTDSEGNDGFYYYVGESIQINFLDGSQNVVIGVKFAQRQAQKKMFSNIGSEGSIRGTFSIPWNIVISPSVSYKQEWHNGPGTVLEFVNRIDGQVRTGLSVTKYIKKNFYVDLSYQYVKNFSNSPVYKYDQHTGILSLGYQF